MTTRRSNPVQVVDAEDRPRWDEGTETLRIQAKAGPLAAAYPRFRLRYGKYYQPPRAQSFARLREQEYGRLDEAGHVYLDYVGGSLHGRSQIEEHAALLNTSVLGNPHSTNPASADAAFHERRCRQAIFSHFGADPAEYEIVFTANASHAIKLVGESFPFARASRLLHLADSHNSVVGLRRYAKAGKAKTTCVPMLPGELRADVEAIERELKKGRKNAPKLFAFTGQSNTTGVKHSLELIRRAQNQGWMVLLDAAALAPTNRFDLSEHPADFVAISFYKMFGYPTGIGCLLARKSALAKLDRPWFAGGTVRLVSAFHQGINVMHDGDSGHHFQDGTIPYSVLPAVTIGLEHLARVGVDNVASRTKALTAWLLERLQMLRHDNGKPLVRLYGPSSVEDRGGTIALNLYDRNGRWIPHPVVEKVAAQYDISIRAGCFCNPGIAEQALGYSQHSGEPAVKIGAAHVWLANKLGLDRLLAEVKPFDTPFGMLRVSFGIASNFSDAWHSSQLIERFLDPEFSDLVTSEYEQSFQPPTSLC